MNGQKLEAWGWFGRGNEIRGEGILDKKFLGSLTRNSWNGKMRIIHWNRVVSHLDAQVGEGGALIGEGRVIHNVPMKHIELAVGHCILEVIGKTCGYY